MAIARAFEFANTLTDKRACDHPTNVVVVELFACDVAQLVQTLQTEMPLVRGDLKHRIRRGIKNRLARADVFLAQFVQNHCAGRVAITQIAGQLRTCDDTIEQLLREGVGFVTEVTPIEQHRHARHFPVAGRRIFARR